MTEPPTTPGSQPSTTPTRHTFHGAPLRGIDSVDTSFSTAGRFGRMFRNLPVFEHDEGQLAALARSMIAPPDRRDADPVPAFPEPDERENPLIPAGYTYVGQFVDHDITFDPVSSLQRQNDPDALHNFRTPRFDLDSVYGRGPADQPYLYRNGPRPDPHPTLGFDQRGVSFLLGEHRGAPDHPAAGRFTGPDLPRNQQGRALIGDPRNDENAIVSQVHGLFLRFHNRMVERVFEMTGFTGDNLFKDAQRLVRWHYQWMVVHDFLARIVDGDPGDGSTHERGIVRDILREESYVTSSGPATVLKPTPRFYAWREQPFLPVEFSVATYRYGHSTVRPSYFVNELVRREMGHRRVPIFSAHDEAGTSLGGLRPLPELWGLQWEYFFELDPAIQPQASFRIDTTLATPLGALPRHADIANLAHRNLLRGSRLGLPSGQAVARAMGIQPLSDGDLGLRERGAPEYDGDAPLWFYILREAELLAGGQHLGPVGGRIVAEVLIGLLLGDALSWLNVEPTWTPPLARNGRFGMPELIEFTLGRPAAAAAPQTSTSPTIDQWRDLFGPAERPVPA